MVLVFACLVPCSGGIAFLMAAAVFMLTVFFNFLSQQWCLAQGLGLAPVGQEAAGLEPPPTPQFT